MPIHLDDLLGDFNAQHRRYDGLPGDKVNLDDVLDSSIDPAVSGLHAMGLSVPDVIGAAGRGVAHLVGIPTELPRTVGEAAHDLATSPLTAPMMGIYGPIASAVDVAKGFAGAKRRFEGSPSTTSKTRAVVSQVPMVGPALDELLGPTEASMEGRPQTRAENLGAVEGGTTLVAAALLPKVAEGLRGEPATEMAGENAEKPATAPETTSPPSATPQFPAGLLDDLVEQAGQAQEEARNRPPEGTWQERTVAALERPRTASDELIGGETPNLTLKAEAVRRAGNMPHLDDLLVEPTDESPKMGESVSSSGKRLWEMSPDELSHEYEIAKVGDSDLLNSLFGEERAKTYRRLERRANSTMLSHDETSAAYDEMERMESSLSPSAKNRLFGVGENVATPDEIRAYWDGLSRLDGSSAEALGDSLKWALTKIEDVPIEEMSEESKVAASQMRHAYGMAEENGWNPQDVLNSALRGAAQRFGPEAEYMLRRYMKPQEGQSVRQQRISGMDVGLPPEDQGGEPVNFSGPKSEPGVDIGTDWIDELPVAEQTAAPPEEPLPVGLAEEPAPQTGLPEQLTSEPQRAAGSSAEQVGADAEQQLEAARTERDGVIRTGLKKGSQIFNALVVPGDDVLLRSGEAGQEAVRTTRPIELRRAMAVGKADSLYHELTASMTPEERAAIPMVMDGKMPIDSPNVTARVRSAIPIVRKFFDDYLARAEAAGTGVERRQDYFPHFREAPVHDIEKPLPEFRKFGMESPSLHFHQVDDRAGYSMDLGYVMRRYAYNAETELQATQAFGGADADSILGKINEWSDKIAATGGDGVLAKKILLEKFNMQEPELPASRKLTRDVGALVGTMNTVTTPIRHIGKYVNALSQIGFRGAAKGLGEMAKAIVDPAARARIRESGVLLRNSFDLVMPNTKENAFYRVTRAMPWIKATKALDAGGRVMTYFGSDPWIDETVAIARGDHQYLGSVTEGMRKRAIADAYNRAHNIFGISDESIKAGKVRPDEREYARLAASDVTEFSPERGQLPYAATVGAAGRLFYNLRKFATSQANFMYNNVVKPATYGNIQPMARFLAGSALAGAAIEPLLHMVNRQPDAVLNYFGVPLRPEGDQGWNDWSKKAMAVGAIHNLGLIYLLVEGRDIMQAVPTASAGLLARGVHGAASDFVNAARQSAGVLSESDKQGVGLPEWWDQAQENIGSMEGRNIKDIARSTQLTWLMRKWYREARGLRDGQ